MFNECLLCGVLLLVRKNRGAVGSHKKNMNEHTHYPTVNSTECIRVLISGCVVAHASSMHEFQNSDYAENDKKTAKKCWEDGHAFVVSLYYRISSE